MAAEARKISSGGTLLGPNDAEQTLITMSTLTGVWGGGPVWVWVWRWWWAWGRRGAPSTWLPCVPGCMGAWLLWDSDRRAWLLPHAESSCFQPW